MRIEDMTREDFNMALKEIQEVESTGILPNGIVRQIAQDINTSKSNIDEAMKRICRKSLELYSKKYKPVMVMNEQQSWKEDLCCGNCKKPFYFERPEKFCNYCGAETELNN